MKKLGLGLLAFLVSVSNAFAVSVTEDHNKITMVTYFPVPYVAYSEINPSKQLDIGLSNTCSLKLGCAESEYTFDNNTQTLLTATNLNVKNGRLNLDAPSAAVVNKNTQLGTNTNGAGEINFNSSVRMQALKDALSVSTDNMELSALDMFPDHITNNFPACAGEDMAWQKVKLKTKEEVYLVCGAVADGCSNAPTQKTDTRSCTTGTGTQTRTWDSYNCKWGEWTGECGETECSWVDAGLDLLNCQTTRAKWCDAGLNSGTWENKYGFITSCAERGTVVSSLAKCPAATQGEECIIREQHSSVNYCPAKPDWEGDRTIITAFQGHRYRAECTLKNCSKPSERQQRQACQAHGGGYTWDANACKCRCPDAYCVL